MSVRTPTRPAVTFALAFPALAARGRTFARRLPRAAFHDLTRDPLPPPQNGSATPALVVLAHADGDPTLLTDALAGPIPAHAYFLLVTGPTTHPEQVARWVKAANVRSEDRLHVARLDDRDLPRLTALLARVAAALGPDPRPGILVDAYRTGDALHVRGPRYRLLHVPVSSLPALVGRPPAVVANFALDPDGSFLHCPDLDVHLGWDQLLQAVDPDALLRSRQRSAAFNRRYGAAIRTVREAAGIAQSAVPDLTDRQLRRIERGDCRATSSALAALARAHGLDLTAYTARLAAALPAADGSRNGQRATRAI